jgi:iron complex outermembrane recepter protein
MTQHSLPNSWRASLTRLALGWFLTFALALAAQAQTAATGTITGRVFNPTTGEYVRNAEIRIQGTNLAAVSEDGGAYQLLGVPAGQVTVTVTYTGYTTASAAVTVTAGQTATQDFDLRSSALQQPKAGEDTIKLDAFVVSSEREGNAKAIMQQRNSMRIGNIVASDVFGDVSEGNVGEFLKYLPGVDLEYVEADSRAPRIGGLDPQYTGVTMNGMTMASADAFIQYNGSDNSGGAGVGSRSFGFEQVSINSVESIEVNLTNTADMDGSTPGGGINLKTKKAFDRKGRHIYIQGNVMANSEDMTINKTYGPDDRKNYKLKPGGIFEYSDVFFNHRLGVVLNISESNMYNQQHLTSYTTNTTTTATDARPLAVTGLSFKSGPKFTERSSATFQADYKVTPHLSVSLPAMYNYYFGTINNRTFSISGSRTTLTGDAFNSFDGPVTLGSSSTFLRKIGRGFSTTPSFEFKLARLAVDGAFGYSYSISDYSGALKKSGIARDTSAGVPAGVSVHAQRSGGTANDWTIVQTAGPDIGNLANFKSSATGTPSISDDGRFAKEQVYQGVLNAQYNTGWALPTYFKIGGKITEQYHQYENRQPWYGYQYIGPGGGLGGSFAAYPSPNRFNMGSDIHILSSSGLSPAFASRNDVADLFNAHPEYFVPSGSVANYLSAYVTNHKYIKEQFNAGYGLANMKIGRLTVQPGIRWEQTKTEAKELNPLSQKAVVAAGYTVGTNGVANTIPGINYQYFSLPQATRSGHYNNFLPSLSAKYNFSQNLQGQFGWSRTFSRPKFNDIAGIWSFNDTNQTVSVPNPNLKPETSDKYVASLSYYFEPAGAFTVRASQQKIKNLAVQTDFPSSAFGYGDDPIYSTYDFISLSNTGGTKTFNELSVDYSQQLVFLPKPFNTLSVRAAYTRDYSDVRRPGLAPHMVSGSLNYRYARFAVGANAKWTDVTPYSSTLGRFRKQRTMVDVNASFRLTKQISLFAQGRNIFDVPDYIYDNGNQAQINKIEYYGALWTFGIKGVF